MFLGMNATGWCGQRFRGTTIRTFPDGCDILALTNLCERLVSPLDAGLSLPDPTRSLGAR